MTVDPSDSPPPAPTADANTLPSGAGRAGSTLPAGGSPGNTPSSANDNSANLQWLREGVTTLLSVGILLITLVMLSATFAQARLVTGANTPSEAAYSHMKDIMLYSLALLGTVTGYYYGRTPAELHAQEAQNSAKTAQADLKTTRADASRENTAQNKNLAASLEMAHSNAEQMRAAHQKQRQATSMLLNIKTLLDQEPSAPDTAPVTHQRSTDAPPTESFTTMRAVTAATPSARPASQAQARQEIDALLNFLNS